jgi:hypothetical protein
MSMYRLDIFYDGEVRHTESRAAAADVLAAIPKLLELHAGCDQIVVWFIGTRLFAVDCKGNTRPG